MSVALPGTVLGARHFLAGFFALAATSLFVARAPAADDAFKPAITTIIEDGRWPLFSPDGQKLAFTRLVLEGGIRINDQLGREPYRRPDIWVRDMKSGEEKLVKSGTKFCGWSGNTSIVIPVATFSLESGKEVPINPELPTKGSAWNGHWSSDGAQMVHHMFPGKNEENARMTLGVIDAKGTRPLKLGHTLNTDSAGFIHWSPDSKYVSFDLLFYRRGNVPVHRMAVINIASGAVKYVGEGAYVHQNWGLLRSEEARSAPNPWDAKSEKFLFVSGRGRGEAELYLSDARGGDVKKLTDDNCSKWSLSFDPAGRRVAFAAGEWGGQDGTLKNMRIRVLDILTGTEQVIKVTSDPSAPDKEFPNRACVTVAWLPDGSGLIYDLIDGMKSDIAMAKFAPPAPLPADSPIKTKEKGSLKDQVLKALASDNRSVVNWGAENAVQLSGPEVVTALRKALSNAVKKEFYQPDIISALRYLDAREAAPELIEAFNAKYEPTRCWSIAVITPWKEKTAIEPLRAVIKSMPDTQTAASAAAALAVMKLDDGWLHLQRLMKSKTADVRGKVASSLDSVPDPRAIDMLIELLNDKARLYSDYTGEVDVGYQAMDSLVELTGKMFGRDQDAWAAWWKQQDRKLPVVPSPNPGLEQLEQDKKRRAQEWQKKLRDR